MLFGLRNALVIGNPYHPHPGEAWGICGGNRGLDFSLCPMGWGLIILPHNKFHCTCYHFTRAGNAMKFEPLRCRREKKIARITLALGQFRQLSSLMSNTERRLGSTKCTCDSKWLTSKAQRSIRHQSIFKIYLSLVFDATSSVFTFDIIK